MILVKSNFCIWPSRYLGIPEEEVDHEAERAFLIASVQKQAKDQKKAEEKARAQAKSKRRR